MICKHGASQLLLLHQVLDKSSLQADVHDGSSQYIGVGHPQRARKRDTDITVCEQIFHLNYCTIEQALPLVRWTEAYAARVQL